MRFSVDGHGLPENLEMGTWILHFVVVREGVFIQEIVVEVIEVGRSGKLLRE